jgi:hypothetical protein
MALEAKNINNATDMRNYVEGCLNDLVEGLSTVEETMVYMKEYTHRIIDLASESQKHDTSGEALPIADVVKPKGTLCLYEAGDTTSARCIHCGREKWEHKRA